MKVKVDGKEYWAKNSKRPPYVFVYANFFKWLIDDLDLNLSWRYLVESNYFNKEDSNNGTK